MNGSSASNGVAEHGQASTNGHTPAAAPRRRRRRRRNPAPAQQDGLPSPDAAPKPDDLTPPGV